MVPGRSPVVDRAGESSQSMEHASRADRTALVVDDDIFVVSALAEILEEEGFDVHTATNGFSAQRLANELRPAIMLLDLALPERSGIDLLKDLRSEPNTRDMAIVIVTGHIDRLPETQVGEIDGLVTKPFDIAELTSTVQRAMQRAAIRRAEVAPAPVVALVHRDGPVRNRRVASRTRGRR